MGTSHTTTWYAGPLTANAGPGNYEGYVAVITPATTATPAITGQPLGQGTMWFTSGNFYEGMWSDGRYHGKGTLRTATFEYIGDFSKGLITGQGIMNYKADGVYQGWFLKRKREGHGTMEWPNGITYTGKWAGDKATTGKVSWPNGDWWESTWNGIESDIWAAKRQTGKGQAHWHDSHNEFYVGATKDRLRHGFGTLTKLDHKYEGNFMHGKRDGRFKVTDLATKKVTHRTYEDDERVDDLLLVAYSH